MISNPQIVAAIVGAAIGAFLAFLFNARLQRTRVNDEFRVKKALELLTILADLVNRESPKQLRTQLPEVRQRWARTHRELYLLSLSDRHRERLDRAIEEYVAAMERWNIDSSAEAEVEQKRVAARDLARRVFRKLGMRM